MNDYFVDDGPSMDHPEREITEPTRRNIAEELVLQNMTPNGRLDEVAFFSRIFNLNDLPTTDSRANQFPDMETDLWQHRINNKDWPDGWWWTDDRLDLLHVPDETFLRFLAEIVHPIVRPEAAERELHLEVFNRHLAPEGWEIGVVGQVGAHPVYGGRRLQKVPPAVAVGVKELATTLGDYVSRQVTRMEVSIADDPDLAIGTAQDFVETICKTILEERGIDISKADDGPALVRMTVKNLPVVPNGIEDPARWKDVARQLVNNLSSIGRNLAELRNAFGTGHGRAAGHMGLDTHHARLAVHTATAVGVFLYEIHEGNPVSG